MGYNYSVLGGGRQGAAIVYDLSLHGEAQSIAVLDSDLRRAEEVAQRTNLLTNRDVVSARVCDANEKAKIRSAVEGSDVVISALPYFLNLNAAMTSMEEQAHFCDLGGNTNVVLEELKLDSFAKDSGVSLLPDCGLAPGLSNLLAAHAITHFDRTDEIKIRCGGIPRIPRPPFFYKLVFSLEGLMNEYSGEAIVLRNGKIAHIPTLTELEEVDVPSFGKMEAMVTSGGTSTAPISFEGKVRNFDYKSLRHPGHWKAMKAFSDLGLFGTEPIEVDGSKVIPRKLMIDLFRPLIDYPADHDAVILLVDAKGEKDGEAKTYRALLIDEGDPKGYFSAMERTTGFPTAAIAYLQASGKISPGAVPIEQSIPLDLFLAELKKRGLKIDGNITTGNQ